MQPGPPYPQQQPGYPGGRPPTGPPPGYPQQGYPPGYQQQPPFPGPPAPRKPRTGLVVLIVVIALLVVGGGTTALILLTNGKSTPAPSNSAAAGHYTKPIPCGRLNGGQYTFNTPEQVQSTSFDATLGCPGQAPDNSNLVVTMDVLIGPDGVTDAKRAVATTFGPQIDGTGFENAPYVYYQGEYQTCTVQYARSNENIQLAFVGLPGVTDQASCVRVAMPYAKRYYQLIG